MIRVYRIERAGRDEHLLGRELARRALRESFGGAELVYDRRGKPGSSREGCYVSIAHSGELCVAAVSDMPIGIDLEKIGERRPERLLALAKRWLAPDELEYVSAAPARRFYEVWCAKESYVKFTGEGLSRGMPTFSTLSDDLGVHFEPFTINNYIGCICTPMRSEIIFENSNA